MLSYFETTPFAYSVILYLTEAEWRVMLLALNRLRSKLIAQGRYTDAVDEIIMIKWWD